jgi:hypothetical protein
MKVFFQKVSSSKSSSMKRIVLLFLLTASVSSAQYSETIATGRPGQAIGPRTLGASVFQFQSGFTYTIVDFEDTQFTTLAQSNVFRVGIWERLDINGVLVWQTDEFSGTMENTSMSGISNSQLGLRYSVMTNKGWRPSVGIQGRVLLKLQDKAYRRESLGTNFVLATGNRLTKSLSLTTNWGLAHSGNNGRPAYSYAINLSAGVTEKIGVFIELYGGLNDLQTFSDTGISYLVNDNLQLDFSLGWQGENDVSNWFVDAGVSWRFDWRDQEKP